MTLLQKLKKRLVKVESELDKNRASTIKDGWQTQRYARKARKWDFLAQEKMALLIKIEELENETRDF
jgi:hypothetical protein